MNKNIILVLITSVFIIIVAISLILRGQWPWGVLLLLLVMVNLYWRISQKRTLIEKEYYDLEEIEKKFLSYRDPKESNITDDEYKVFCGEIKMLPAIIINRIYDEIYFVFMSGDSENVDLACYLNLREKCFLKKKGIVVLSSYILGTPYNDKSGEEKIHLGCVHGYKILHEIAHHILNHSYKKGIEVDEKKAWAQVKEWEKKYSEFQENE